MKKWFFKFKLYVLILFTLPLFPNISLSLTAPNNPTMADYTASPIFITQSVTPNIMILLDNSGSMNEFAYKNNPYPYTTTSSSGRNTRNVPVNSVSGFSVGDYIYIFVSGGYYYRRITGINQQNNVITVNWSVTFSQGDDVMHVGYYWFTESKYYPDTSYNPSNNYYGYFDSNEMYKYISTSGGYFMIDSSKPLDKTSFWSGNFLNWLTMRRVDIMRKVLVGGKALNRASNNPKYLIAMEDSDRNFWKKYGNQLYYVYGTGSVEKIRVCSNASCSSGTQYSVKIYVGDQEPDGVIQKTADRVRFGLMFFNSYGNSYEDGYRRDGAYLQNDVGALTTSIVTSIENTDPLTWTPLAESLYEATRIFRGERSAYNGGVNYAPKDPIQYSCQKNFVLILTDGESTKDENLPGTCFGGYGSAVSDSSGFNVRTWMNNIASNEGYSSQACTPANSSDGTYYLEGVAYWAHVTDLRSDWSGEQSITTYTVFAFDDSPIGRDILQKAAKYGGFDDKNGNDIPDLQAEWDEDEDGSPDTYFEAQEGSRLEQALISAINDILKRASSGTAVSVLATSAEGAGSLFQAFFKPIVYEGIEERKRKWFGYLQGLFLDPYGNLREDTDGDHRLVLENDRIITFKIDSEGNTVIERWTDTDGDGDADTKFDEISSDSSEFHPLWEAGRILANTNPADRNIYTFVDSNKNMKADSGEFIEFSTTNASTLRPFLRASNLTEANNIINYIRGTPISGYREREVTVGGVSRTWKLGDIVYSTPTFVGKPSERYDVIYGDESYLEFVNHYKNRDNVVYVGSNDGMLHAFKAGLYHDGDDPDTTDKTEHGWITGTNLGEEIWAYIPYNLLPHLKWLTQTDYSHIYYVDLKPKVTDVKIFANDTKHPGGWGTILIGGMRFGGGAINVTDDFGGGSETRKFQSAYFILDITDPSDPELLCEWTDDDLGFTLSYPAVAKIGDNWFAIWGSGPTNYDGDSSQSSSLYVFDLNTLTNGAKFTGDNNAFMSSPITVDRNLNYNVDLTYIGETYIQGSNYKGKMYRLYTKDADGNYETDPTNWTLSTLLTTDAPITSAASASLDSRNNIWVFLGTGRYLKEADKTDTSDQYLYGVKDLCDQSCSNPITDSDLYDTTNVKVYVGDEVDVGGSTIPFHTFVENVRAQSGWYITLTGGERNLQKPALIGGLSIFTTFTPSSDVCGFGGSGTLYALYFETGSAYPADILGTQTQGGKTEYLKSTELGSGMPSSTGLQIGVGNKASGFVQQSTGAIVKIDTGLPFNPKNRTIFWRQR
jgi:type IV pilus assembly protein PilY1